MRSEPSVGIYNTVRWFVLTAGRWTWKPKSAKTCTATQRPNGLAPVMNGSQAVGADIQPMLQPRCLSEKKGVGL